VDAREGEWRRERKEKWGDGLTEGRRRSPFVIVAKSIKAQ
jgi:hypothetical protein